ncbi:MAG: flagellar assembly protein FliW [Syntrophales bacterium]|nr:flagellar assembly protein FliW [Syntrophales bacterium]
MIIHTRFGDWEIDEEKIIYMEGPILGFDKVREYALIPVGDGIPLFCFQAVYEPTVAFFVVEPKIFCPSYAPDIEKICRELDILSDEELVVLSIMTVRENPFSVTINLRAPLLINARTKKGRQVVLEEDKYPVRYAIEIEKKGKETTSQPPSCSAIKNLTTEHIRHYG